VTAVRLTGPQLETLGRLATAGATGGGLHRSNGDGPYTVHWRPVDRLIRLGYARRVDAGRRVEITAAGRDRLVNLGVDL